MKGSNPGQEELLASLRNKMIPWAGSESLRLVMAQPPFHVPDDVQVRPVKAPVLANKTKAHSAVTKWPAAAMNSIPYPCFCCILQGAVEWRVGITRRMLQASPQLQPQYGRYVLRLPTETFLVMPAGVPFNDASQPHWSSEGEDIPDSLIFWIHFTPQGADLHLCRTRSGVHQSLLPAYIQDTHLLALAEMLLEDLQAATPHSSTTAHYYLLLILLRIERMLKHGKGLYTSEGSPYMSHSQDDIAKTDQSASPHTSTEELYIKRAQRFIQAHLTTPLSVQYIADHLYISPSHLTRLFQRELGVSPMKYVTQLRMELARSLLTETEHPIQYISDFFGYSHPDVFSRAFKQQVGVSPRKFRRKPL